MIAEAFLICALSVPATNFTRPAIISWIFMKSEEEQLTDWLKKHNEIDDVFITPRGQQDKLKEYGWERVPFTIHDKEIWIQRKPKSDQKGQKMIGASA